MDLYKGIFAEVFSKQKIKISFEDLKMESPNGIVEMTCYKAIKRIRKILDNDSLDDFE